LEIDFDESMISTEPFDEREVAYDSNVNMEPADVD